MKTPSKIALTRLRADRLAFENSPASIGFAHGKAWAEDRATYAQLDQLGLWWSKFQFAPAGTSTTLAFEVANAIYPNVGRNGLRTVAEDLFLRQGNEAPDGIPNDYVIQWIVGATRVLNAVHAE